MGQTRQTSDDLTEHEEQDRHAAGYIDEPKNVNHTSQAVFISQRVGTHVLLIYPPPFDPQQNEEEIAMECLQQVHIDSVDMEVTEDLFEIDGSRLPLVFEDPSLDFYGLTAIQYQGYIILWL